MARISILGSGWLGFPLAQALVLKGFQVNGSTTSAEKEEVFKRSGINHCQISLGEAVEPDTLQAFLGQSDILIIAIPPKLRGKNKDYSQAKSNSFVDKIGGMISFIEKSTISRVLFVSSTAVYGNSNGWVSENTPPNPSTESGRQILEVEKMLAENSNFQTTVLRFGGLIGPGRNPANFLAGKQNLDNPESVINLIHLDDCIGLINGIIEKQLWGETFNGVTPYHPTRKEYYTQKCIEHQLIPPTFISQVFNESKIIQAEKIVKALVYSFVYPEL